MDKRTEITRFRLWVADDTCYEGEATVTIYEGSNDRDEFGFSDGDDTSADITRCYRCTEGEVPVEIFPYTHGFNLRLQRDLEHAAIDAHYGFAGLPVVFPDEQQETPLQKAA